MLEVQKYLLNHSFEDLAKDHGIYCSFSTDGHKFSLNYDMLESKDSDPLAQECRGLILGFDDKAKHRPHDKQTSLKLVPGKTSIVAYGLRRFFNEGQGSAYVNWGDPNLCVMEKLDGTLILLYFDHIKAKWHCATRSVPEANLKNESLMTFRELFEKALLETCNKSFDDFTLSLDKNKTYCFELCSPYNGIVCLYEKTSITLLSIRNNLTFLEEEIIDLDIPKIKTYPLKDIKQINEWIATTNPLHHEGVVVRDSNFNRVKIKSPSYVAFNKLAHNVKTSNRSLLEIILLEKEDDVISFLPDFYVDKINSFKSSIKNIINAHNSIYSKAFAESEDRKHFASLILVQDNIWSAPLFFMYGTDKTFKDFIQHNKSNNSWTFGFLDKLLELIKKY